MAILTEEQTMLRDAARDWVQARSPVGAFRKLRDSGDGAGYDPALWRVFPHEHFDMVIDATHPYAAEITENIADACAKTGTPYQRLLRKGSDIHKDAVIVPDISAAVDFLNKTTGNILLTTGSKEVFSFSALDHFAERVYARILPMRSSLDICLEAGLQPSHIIAMQGPFSEDLNRSLLRSFKAEWLVTKDSGEIGGFDAKAAAAVKENVRLVVIGRPIQRNGLSFSEMLDLICERFGFSIKPSVKIIGIGPGSRDGMTVKAVQAIEEAECLIGAKRMLESASFSEAKTFEIGRAHV